MAQEWSSRFGYSISKLLLPMNHMVILAGMCTLIGTSTNLIVNSMLVKAVPDSGLSLFSLIWIGLPLTLIGFVYMLVASRWLLPDRQGPVEQLENAREYSVEARVTPNGPLVGRSDRGGRAAQHEVSPSCSRSAAASGCSPRWGRTRCCRPTTASPSWASWTPSTSCGVSRACWSPRTRPSS